MLKEMIGYSGQIKWNTKIKEIPYEKDSIKDIRVNSPEVIGALN